MVGQAIARAGPLMTEEAALICTLENGGIDVRFPSRKLRRLAAGAAGGGQGAAADADAAPLAVPKKSKLFLEFAKRERDNAQAMYHTFQQCGPPRAVLRFRLWWRLCGRPPKITQRWAVYWSVSV